MPKKRTLMITVFAVVLMTASAFAILHAQSKNNAINSTPQTEAKLSRGCSHGGNCAVNTAGGGGNCCSRPAGAGSPKPQQMITALQNYLHKIYAQKLDDPQITVEVKDLGCHMEAYVRKGAEVLKHLSISGGNIEEIG